MALCFKVWYCLLCKKAGPIQNRSFPLVGILEHFAQNDVRANIASKQVSSLYSFLEIITSLSDPRAKCFAYAFTIQMYSSIDQKAVQNFASQLKESWEAVDQAWEKVELGFDIAAIVAQGDEELARELIASAAEQREHTPLAESILAEITINLIKLVIRTIPEMVKQTPEDYQLDQQKLTRFISSLPSQALQCILFAEIAMRLRLADEEERFQKLISEEVLTRLENLQSISDNTVQDHSAYIYVLKTISPCLYRFERRILLEKLSEASTVQKDEALGNVIQHILTDRPIGDPIDLKSIPFRIEYHQALKVCELLGEMQTDAIIYTYLDHLINALIEAKILKPNSQQEICKLNERNAISIAKELTKVIDSKLPDPNNIQHEGYKIAAWACVAQLRESVKITSHRAKIRWRELAPSWEELVAEAKKLTNVADKALVLTWVGRKMYWSQMNLAHEILKEAEECIKEIPNVVDRSSRLKHLAESWNEVNDVESAKIILKEAMTILQAWSWDSTRDQVTEEILEVAHSVDPEFAASLTSTIDNPLVKHNVEQDLIVRELKHTPEKITKREAKASNSHDLYSGMAKQLLGSLCSGKGLIQQEKNVREWIFALLNANYTQTYHMLAWAIENEIAKQIRRHNPMLDNLYNGLLDLIELTQAMGRVLTDPKNEISFYRRDTHIPASLKFFSIGTREEAMVALQNWIKENVREYLMIHDPYFSDADLDILKYVSSATRVTVLTSWTAQENLSPGDTKTLEQRYNAVWQKIADQSPPQTRFYVFGTGSGHSPLHERFYITAEGQGIKFGTSPSGFGKHQTDFRELEPDEARSIENEFIKRYILNPPTHHKGEKLMNNIFVLDTNRS